MAPSANIVLYSIYIDRQHRDNNVYYTIDAQGMTQNLRYVYVYRIRSQNLLFPFLGRNQQSKVIGSVTINSANAILETKKRICIHDNRLFRSKHVIMWFSARISAHTTESEVFFWTSENRSYLLLNNKFNKKKVEKKTFYTVIAPVTECIKREQVITINYRGKTFLNFFLLPQIHSLLWFLFVCAL